MNSMHNDVAEILADEEQISAIVKTLGKQLTEEYAGCNPLILCILKGAAPFAMDLIRAIDCPAEMDFLQVSSYGNGVTSQGFVFKKDTDIDLADRDVILVDDILDTGNTLMNLRELLSTRGTKSIRICVMFDKKPRRTAPIEADYVGMEVPDEFLVGYGLDYAEKYRNLPYVGILKPEVYTEK